MTMHNVPNEKAYIELIEMAKVEDLGVGDITSEVTIGEATMGEARLVFREEGIVCGMPIVTTVLGCYDAALSLEVLVEDGERVTPGTTVGVIRGPMRAVLAAERIVLNFLQHLSGVATVTSRYVDVVAGTAAKICDTRKTTPGWRELEKYAVRCGGGTNHRQGLYDAVLIKDNHLTAFGDIGLKASLEKAIGLIKQVGRELQFVEVEVDTLEQLREVLTVDGVDIVLLDNMAAGVLREAIAIRSEMGLDGKVEYEASGGITMETLRGIAETGVERISVGALTHSVRNLDIGLDMG